MFFKKALFPNLKVAASLVIAQCLSRTDGIPLIGEALTKPLSLIQKIEPEINEPVGHLLLVASILKVFQISRIL